MPDLATQPTTAQRRTRARVRAQYARLNLLAVAKELDPLNETTPHMKCMAALATVDDLIDGIDAREELDRELDSISEGERGLRAFCDERGIQEPSL